MRVLVLGGGGREHALCWALSNAPSVDTVLCAPGNAGIAAVADVRAVDPADTALVRELAVREELDLVVVGPEEPLVADVAGTLDVAGVPVFGPTRDAARIESSKSFAKAVMAAAGVPSARHWAGSNTDEAAAALDGFSPPYVVKADGLAAGKGVRICPDRDGALAAIDAALVERVYGEAGARVVVEEYLSGPEVSLFGLCDGDTVVPMAAAQDYKRALDGDAGPNTGGMGAYSPVPAVGDELLADLGRAVLEPVAAELASRGSRYVGVLYAGLVLTGDGPKVLEFNARFGDPEAQAILPRLRTDLGELLLACATGRLADAPAPRWDPRACVTVVLASAAYPEPSPDGVAVDGLDDAAGVEGAYVFHAGTRSEGRRVVTAGGRVLSVSGLGATLADARATAYAAADRIRFDGLHRRSDIAAAPVGG